MNSSGIRIGIMCPGFTPPTKAELVKFRGDAQRQREEGLARAILLSLWRVPLDSLMKASNQPICVLPLRAETDPVALKQVVKRYRSAGWQCEVVEDKTGSAPRPAVQFFGGQDSTRQLEFAFGLYPPGPQQLAAYRTNSADPWVRIEGVVLGLWQILAKEGTFSAAVPLKDRVNKNRPKRTIRPAFADVLRGVEERFEASGWWTTYHSNWFHVAEAAELS